jgi:hypothetical protein
LFSKDLSAKSVHAIELVSINILSRFTAAFISFYLHFIKATGEEIYRQFLIHLYSFYHHLLRYRKSCVGVQSERRKEKAFPLFGCVRGAPAVTYAALCFWNSSLNTFLSHETSVNLTSCEFREAEKRGNLKFYCLQSFQVQR